eukprot:CAMPEP_0197574700 /NCGR_PEP_ID=MMETSP1326-20131121/345_1 /TAXON_ID=1155430 /ORGANISM="Genus nov. species nov., Strain RCC2288" /LENGTH=249 /DNA_ID=CAMNT_0043137331 /DNA_START=404 /DNA_END=1153 /DNA_ORIENTATION=+
MAALASQQFATVTAGLKSRVAAGASKASRARVVSVNAAATRPNFFPGSTPPAHLKGEMAGDYGFDPLGLGEDPEALKWYVQAELQHARWAMLGVTGMAAVELVDNPLVNGAMPNWAEAPFYDGYIADNNTLFVVQMFLMNWAEVRRWQDMKNPGSVNADPYNEKLVCTGKDVGYPGGGLFNPMNIYTDPADEKRMRVKEIANGRLAMVAVMGCFIQYDVTGVGCVANLKAHLADPAHVSILANFQPIHF